MKFSSYCQLLCMYLVELRDHTVTSMSDYITSYRITSHLLTVQPGRYREGSMEPKLQSLSHVR